MVGATGVPLVGRSEELGRVLAALERAGAGSGGALLLAGEAGIGKSRLAAEALTLARQRGFITLEGAAYPLQADLAYAPVLEALAPFLAGLQPARRAALVSGLPDLGRLFAGLHLPPPEPLGDAALERTRLFEAVSRLVERVAAGRPVALLVDDLHWADAASLELLHYLARGLGDRRVLLLGTYRLDEARTHPRLKALVRSLQRLGLAEELPLGGLGPDAVAALARALLGGEPPAELLGTLRERAAGTPLFVTELIRGLCDSGGLFRSGGAWVLGGGSLIAVPPVVRDLVLGRLEQLDPADRALLELVASPGTSPPRLSCAGPAGRERGNWRTGCAASASSAWWWRSPPGPTSSTVPPTPWSPRSPMASCRRPGGVGSTRASRPPWRRSARATRSGSLTTTGAQRGRPTLDARWTSSSPPAGGPRSFTPTPRPPTISLPPWNWPAPIGPPWWGGC
jgi:AAA ATPase domain